MSTEETKTEKPKIVYKAKIDNACEHFLFEEQSSSEYYIGEFEKKRVLEFHFGRKPFRSYGSPTYPFHPNFIKFGNAEIIRETDVEKEEVKKVISDEDVDSDVLEEALTNMLLDKIRQNTLSSDHLNLQKLIKEAEKKKGKDSAEVDSEILDLSVLDPSIILDELKGFLTGIVKKHAKKTVVKKRVSRNSKEIKTYHVLVFDFGSPEKKNHLRIIVDDVKTLALFNLLMPLIQSKYERNARIKDWRNNGVPEDERDYEVKSKYVPFEHQWTMYKIQMELPQCANLSQMGTGKTFAVLMSIDKRMQLGELHKGRTLIVCPATLCENWEKEIKLHTPHLTSKIIEGSYGIRMQTVLDENPPDIFIVNYEAFAMKQTMKNKNKEDVEIPLAAIFTLVDWDMIVLDEAHKVKSPSAKRTQNMLKYLTSAPYSVIMSGTINANKVYDLHAPFVFLNHAKQFNSIIAERSVDETGRSKLLPFSELHENFINAYFDVSGYNVSPKHGAIEEIKQKLAEVSVRFEKHECLTLPEKMYEHRIVHLSEEHMKLYNALREKFLADLSEMAEKGGHITIMNVLSMMMKLAECANGWVNDNEGNTIKLPWNPKLDAVLDIIEDLDDESKVVIYTRFTNDLHNFAEKLEEAYGKESVAVMHGGESCSICGARKDERFAITQRFNDLKSPLKFVVANSAVASHGIDLTGATYEIFFSNSFVKTDRVQAEDRCHRIGMRDSLTIYDIIARGTIDEDVLVALKSWKSMSSALLGHLGIKIENLFENPQKEEAPVIIEHQRQGKKECALSCIAMLGNVSTDDVREYGLKNVANKPWSEYSAEEHVKVAAKFTPELAVGLAEYYFKDGYNGKVSMEELTIPKEGKGAVILRNSGKLKKTTHIIVYANGTIFDPSQVGPMSYDDFVAWYKGKGMVIEWVKEL